MIARLLREPECSFASRPFGSRGATGQAGPIDKFQKPHIGPNGDQTSRRAVAWMVWPPE
jgi:hypothetical protein